MPDDEQLEPRPVSAALFFELRDLWVRDEILGTSTQFVHDGNEVTLTFPPPQPDGPRWPDGWFGDVFGSDAPGRTFELRTVRIVKITIAFTSAGEHMDVLDEAIDKAAAPVAAFRELCRVRHQQYWLGLRSDVPRRVGGIQTTVDGQTRHHMGGDVPLYPGGAALRADTITRVVQDLEAHNMPSDTAGLVHDAAYLLLWADSFDPASAVLRAAIACEVRVREVLRTKTPPDRLPLVDVMLKRLRQVELAAHFLFDEPMKAAVGRSLREDDGDLYKDVRKLFETRNSVAHGGEIPELEIARKCGRAAFRAHQWLDELELP